MKTKVSVIIPAYNTEEYIKKCLDSILEQTFKEFEIICVYRESKDNTINILREYEKEANIKIIEKNEGGLGGARNEGLRHANGDYIFFLDSDDWIKNNALEMLYDKATNTESDIVIFPFYSYDDVLKSVQENSWGYQLDFDNKLFTKCFDYKEINPKKLISGEAPVVAWNKLYKRDFLEKNNILFPENKRYEDNPFYYECMIKADKICLLNKHLLYYRVNRNESLQASSYDNKNILDIVDIMGYIKETFEKNHVSEAYMNRLEEYTLNEFVWRYDVMNILCTEMREKVKNTFNDEFYKKFLRKINFKDYKNITIAKKNKSVNPKISIILPVFNVAKYIDDCINSIINQSLEDIEILFIDDCSTDDSAKIIKKYQEFDERIIYYKNEKNMGAGESRNIGLNLAKGEFVSFLDPDDLYASDEILEKFYTAAIKNNVLSVAGNIKIIEQNYHYQDKANFQNYNGYCFNEDRVYNFSEYNIWSSWGYTRFIYNREHIIKNKIMFPSYRHYEDPLFFVNFMISSPSFYGINEDFYLYRYIPKHRNYNYIAIVDTLVSIENILKLYYKNKLYNHYANEYVSFINFVSNEFNNFLNSKGEEVTSVTKKIDNILNHIDYKIIEKYYPDKILKDCNEIKKKKQIQEKKNYIKNLGKKLLKPIYSRLMWRIEQKILLNNNDINRDINILRQYNEELFNEINVYKQEFSKFKIQMDNLTNENEKIKTALNSVDDYVDYKTNKKKYNPGEKIKTIILFQFASFWPSIESVYNEIKNNQLFECKFLLIKNTLEPSQAKSAEKFLKSQNIEYDIASIELIEAYDPHIIFYQSPYDEWHRDETLFSKNIAKKGYRIIYIPYGLEISDEERSINLQYKIPFYDNCWKIYVLSDRIKNRYYENKLYLKNNVVVSTGHPKFDYLHNNKKYFNKKYRINDKKNIMLKLHFPLTLNEEYGGKQLTPNKEIILNFLKNDKFKEQYNLYVMLHPKFYDEMNEEDRKNYKKLFEMRQAILVEDDDYREPINNMDAIISDRSSVLVEIGALNIPILFLRGLGDEKIGKQFEDLFQSYEQGYTEKDINKFIKNVLENKDINKQIREETFKNCITNFDGKSSERIIKDIIESLEKEN